MHAWGSRSGKMAELERRIKEAVGPDEVLLARLVLDAKVYGIAALRRKDDGTYERIEPERLMVRT